MNHYFFDAAILLTIAYTLFHLTYLGRQLMSTQETVDQLTAQVNKIATEVASAKTALETRLAEVQAQLDAAGVAEQVDLSSLSAAVQALDDINPDTPVE